eukprot:TRINITY_DN45027_c0_g1_i1.p2 TRINITY_DN45027_c0_g1~~TRINITY_DN45027_c0_g1_i1.p2  ORF type:complete len:142 (-),score=3.15 TRINITY_DN45027_c0_g1_i1:210-635(-)
MPCFHPASIPEFTEGRVLAICVQKLQLGLLVEYIANTHKLLNCWQYVSLKAYLQKQAEVFSTLQRLLKQSKTEVSSTSPVVDVSILFKVIKQEEDPKDVEKADTSASRPQKFVLWIAEQPELLEQMHAYVPLPESEYVCLK